jgi:hypothetical protein
MSNTKDYHKTTEKLQSLVDKLGKSNTIKALSTNYRQVQAILDGKKKFISNKVVNRIDNLYAEVFNGKIETWKSGTVIKVDDIEEDFKKHLLKAEDKILNIYADKEYNKKVVGLYKRIDRLWGLIFTLCMLLIICSGLIISLAR